jgi:hypothetical protein
MISRQRTTAEWVRSSAAKVDNMNTATKATARSALATISEQAARPAEQATRASCSARCRIGSFTAGTIGDIDADREQVPDEATQADIAVDATHHRSVDLDHHVEVAIGPGLAAGDGAEQGRLPDAAAAQLGLVGAQDGEGVVAVHGEEAGRMRSPAD